MRRCIRWLAFGSSAVLSSACGSESDGLPGVEQLRDLPVASDAGGTSSLVTDAGVSGWTTYGVTGTAAGHAVTPPAWHVRPATPDEVSRAATLKASLPTYAGSNSAAPSMSATAETLQWVATQPTNSTVRLTLLLDEKPFDWTQLRAVTDETRAAAISRRKAALQDPQAGIVTRLAAMGVTTIRQMWAANQIQASVEAGLVPTIAAWPEIVSLQHAVPVIPSGTVNAGYYGGDRRHDVGADRLINSSYLGGYGGGSDGSGAVRITDVGAGATSLSNVVPEYHPGFETASHYPRLVQDLVCTATPSSSCEDAPQPTAETHDTIVMGVMVGNIEQGQDSAYPGSATSDQIDRSGIALNATPSYIGGATDTADIAVALEEAIGIGSRIINNSWNATVGIPSPNIDNSGVNEILESAAASGVLVVFSAGDNNTSNTTFSTTCNEGWPANRTEVLAVNGLWTVYKTGGGVKSTPAMGPIAWSTSGCPVDVYNGSSYVAQTSVMLGPSAPGYVGENYYWNSYTDYGYKAPGSAPGIGSSFAAPIVAASAALLADSYYQHGYGLWPSYWLKSDLMMLTDGYNFTSYSENLDTHLPGGISPYSGTGRLRLHYAANDSFDSPGWSWTWGDGELSPGRVYERNIPANFEHYRLAFTGSNRISRRPLTLTCISMQSKVTVLPCASLLLLHNTTIP